MATIDEQFVEYIVKSLVGKPDAVKIDRRVDEKGVLLELTVDPEDLGRVIGKRGATAQSMRILLRALGTKNEARYNLKIVDNGEPRPRRDDDQAMSSDSSDSNDTTFSDDSASDNTADDQQATQEPVAENEAPSDSWSNNDSQEVAASEDEVEQESVASRTRKELEDLDDLDV